MLPLVGALLKEKMRHLNSILDLYFIFAGFHKVIN